MTRLELIKELIGEENSEYIAQDIKESYDVLQEEYNKTFDDIDRTPIWSYEKDEELLKIEEMMSAMEIVHSWYSIQHIDTETPKNTGEKDDV